MNKEELKIVLSKVNNVKKNYSEETLRSELFCIIPYIILDNQLFKRNIHIKDFLIKCDDFFKEYRDYVYSSRTLLLSKIIRSISKADKLFMYNMLLEIKKLDFEQEKNSNFINKKITEKNSKERKKKNYTDELFSQFERGGGNV